MTELVRNSFFQIQIRLGGVRVGLAVGLRGGVVAVQSTRHCWLVVVGRVV
ncbi:MAG TPA: hypothetical protein VNO30_32895 [Kofleriaceae bacterium]|nr:hypothetical protein [Kofleriaceae bacterium]